MCRRPFAAAALFGLTFGVTGPYLAVAFAASAEAPFCGRDGHCCCEGRAATDPDATCIRGQCGCHRPDPFTPGPSVRDPAVLAGAASVVRPLAVATVRPSVASVPPSFVAPPLLPPPRPGA